MPGAGALRERLRFERRAIVDDGYGNEVSGDFEPMFTVAASLTPLRGGEDVMASRLGGVQPYVARVRQSSLTRQVSTDWRAVDARKPDREFNIRTITDLDGRRAWFDMIVTEGVAT